MSAAIQMKQGGATSVKNFGQLKKPETAEEALVIYDQAQLYIEAGAPLDDVTSKIVVPLLWAGREFHATGALGVDHTIEIKLLEKILGAQASDRPLSPYNRGILICQLGILHRYSGDFEGAEKALVEGTTLLRGLRENADAAGFGRQLALLYDEKGEYDKARQVIDLAIRRADYAVEKNSSVGYDIGWLRGPGCRGVKADLYANEIIRNGPQSENYVRSLRKALRMFDRAEQLAPVELRGKALPFYQRSNVILYLADAVGSQQRQQLLEELVESSKAALVKDRDPGRAFNLGLDNLVLARAQFGLKNFNEAREAVTKAEEYLRDSQRTDKKILTALQTIRLKIEQTA